MFNLNGIWVEAKDVQSILPNGNEVHISLANGATYNIPGEVGVAIEETAAKMVDAVHHARIAAPVLLPPPSMSIDQIIESGARQTPLGGDIDGYEQEMSFVGRPAFSDETLRDAQNEKYFGDGWRACLREVNLQKLNGTLDVFLEEMIAAEKRGVDSSSLVDSDPEPWIEDVHPVVDSGEPELENMNVTVPINQGKVTLEYEEWQGGLDDAYNRGRKDPLTDHPQITERTLKTWTNEIIVEAGGSPPNNYTFVRRFLTRLGFEIVP